MRLKGKIRPSDHRLCTMCVSLIIFFSLVFLITNGCTDNKQPDQVKPPTNKVVIPIKKGPAQKASIPPAGEKGGDQLGTESSEKPVMAAQDEASPETEEKASEKTELPAEDKGQEQAADSGHMAVETATQKQETQTQLPVQERSGTGRIVETAGHFYKVVKGDNLLTVAGRKEIYDDPYKWTSLFRQNMGTLGSTPFKEEYVVEALPEGIELKYLTPEEVSENLKKMDRHLWVINALSFQDPDKLVVPALKLMKMGYQVYITSGKVNGKVWMRLRVGFFKDRSEADAAGDKVGSVAGAEDAWITKVKESEFEEYAGY